MEIYEEIEKAICAKLEEIETPSFAEMLLKVYEKVKCQNEN